MAGSSWSDMGASAISRGRSWVLPAKSDTLRVRDMKPRWLMVIRASPGVSAGILREKTPSLLETLLILEPFRLTDEKKRDSEPEPSTTWPWRVMTPTSCPAAVKARKAEQKVSRMDLRMAFID